MKYTDEELQNKFDRQDFSGDGVDAESYRKVYNVLQREPNYKLPINFADRLVSLVEEKESKKQSTRDTFWLVLGLVSFAIGCFITIYLTDFKFSVGVFKFISGYPGLIVFAIAFVLFLNWVDGNVIHKTRTS